VKNGVWLQEVKYNPIMKYVYAITALVQIIYPFRGIKVFFNNPFVDTAISAYNKKEVG
jgi:hypothetical protein